MEFKIGDYVNVKTAEGDVACKVVEECGASYYGVRNEQHMTIYTSSRFMTPLSQGAALAALQQAEAAEAAEEAEHERQYNEDVEDWEDQFEDDDESENEDEDTEKSPDGDFTDGESDDAEETEEDECEPQDDPDAGSSEDTGTAPVPGSWENIDESCASGGDCDPSGLTEIVDVWNLGWQAILEGAPVRVVKLTKVDGIWFIHGKSIYTHKMVVARLYGGDRDVLPYPFEP